MPTTAKIVPAASAALVGRCGACAFSSLWRRSAPAGSTASATASITPEDYRVRHPLVLTHQDITLDIFPEGPVLDRARGRGSRNSPPVIKNVGEGPFTILLPQGTAHDEIARHALAAIRKALAAGGATGAVNVGTYPVARPGARLAGADQLCRPEGDRRVALRRMAGRSRLRRACPGMGEPSLLEPGLCLPDRLRRPGRRPARSRLATRRAAERRRHAHPRHRPCPQGRGSRHQLDDQE